MLFFYFLLFFYFFFFIFYFLFFIFFFFLVFIYKHILFLIFYLFFSFFFFFKVHLMFFPLLLPFNPPPDGFQIAIGELIGAGCFVTMTGALFFFLSFSFFFSLFSFPFQIPLPSPPSFLFLVVGVVAIVATCNVKKVAFIRDVCFYMTGVCIVAFLISFGEIFVYEVCIYLLDSFLSFLFLTKPNQKHNKTN